MPKGETEGPAFVGLEESRVDLTRSRAACRSEEVSEVVKGAIERAGSLGGGRGELRI